MTFTQNNDLNENWITIGPKVLLLGRQVDDAYINIDDLGQRSRSW